MEKVTIDNISIGYGLQIDDVNGDGKLTYYSLTKVRFSGTKIRLGSNTSSRKISRSEIMFALQQRILMEMASVKSQSEVNGTTVKA